MAESEANCPESFPMAVRPAATKTDLVISSSLNKTDETSIGLENHFDFVFQVSAKSEKVRAECDGIKIPT
jgi:hypothetical protein